MKSHIILYMVDLVGHGSNQDLAGRLDRLTDRIARLEQSFAKAGPLVPTRPQRKRRRWGEMAEAIVAVLASSGELQARDIHAAVEALLNEPVSASSVKNCLATHIADDPLLFERIRRGRYRLPR